jgi:hypothetical protein
VCRVPVAAVLLAGVQVICVNYESVTGAMLPGVRCKARRRQTKLLTKPRLILDPPPKPELLPGQVHGPSEHASGRVREHVTLGGVASAARSSTRIRVGVYSTACACSCCSIGACLVVRHLVRHDTLQDGRIGNPRARGFVCGERVCARSPENLKKNRVIMRKD